MTDPIESLTEETIARDRHEALRALDQAASHYLAQPDNEVLQAAYLAARENLDQVIAREALIIGDQKIPVETPPCPLCGEASVAYLTTEEYERVISPVFLIQEALPTRDANFRELIKTGTHPACWDLLMGGASDE